MDHTKLEGLGAKVLAISVDHIWAHKAFSAGLGGLPYPLLADWTKATTRRYGVLNEEGGHAQRSVFVIDRAGRVQFVNPRFDARKREGYDALLEAVERLKP